MDRFIKDAYKSTEISAKFILGARLWDFLRYGFLTQVFLLVLNVCWEYLPQPKDVLAKHAEFYAKKREGFVN